MHEHEFCTHEHEGTRDAHMKTSSTELEAGSDQSPKSQEFCFSNSTLS